MESLYFLPCLASENRGDNRIRFTVVPRFYYLRSRAHHNNLIFHGLGIVIP